MLQTFRKFRYRYVPDHFIGEILAKRWMDDGRPGPHSRRHRVRVRPSPAGRLSPSGALPIVCRQAGEIGLVVLGLDLVMIVGRHRSVCRIDVRA